MTGAANEVADEDQSPFLEQVARLSAALPAERQGDLASITQMVAHLLGPPRLEGEPFVLSPGPAGVSEFFRTLATETELGANGSPDAAVALVFNRQTKETGIMVHNLNPQEYHWFIQRVHASLGDKPRSAGGIVLPN